MSALELCFYFVCHLLRKESPTLQLEELILVLFVVCKTEFFLEDDLGVNQTQKIDYQKRSPAIHVSRGRRLSRLSMDRELGINLYFCIRPHHLRDQSFFVSRSPSSWSSAESPPRRWASCFAVVLLLHPASLREHSAHPYLRVRLSRRARNFSHRYWNGHYFGARFSIWRFGSLSCPVGNCGNSSSVKTSLCFASRFAPDTVGGVGTLASAKLPSQRQHLSSQVHRANPCRDPRPSFHWHCDWNYTLACKNIGPSWPSPHRPPRFQDVARQQAWPPILQTFTMRS